MQKSFWKSLFFNILLITCILIILCLVAFYVTGVLNISKINLFFYIIISAIAIGNSILLFTIIRRNIIRIVNVTNESLSQISDGIFPQPTVPKPLERFNDLTQKMLDLNKRIRAHYNGFHSSTKKLQDYQKYIQINVDAFMETFEDQLTNTSNLLSSIEMILSTEELVSGNTNEQFENILTIISTMQEFSQVVDNTTEEMQEIQKNFDHIREDVEQSEQSMGKMHLNITNIEKSSSEMSNIINIINGIFEKINLLSLNASIEAARAGESGRGFAVVANEISKLADLTSANTKEIDSLIKLNREEIKTGASQIEQIIHFMKNVIMVIEKIRHMFESVHKNMNRQLELYNKIHMLTSNDISDNNNRTKGLLQSQKLAIEPLKSFIANIEKMCHVNENAAKKLSDDIKDIKNITNFILSKIHELFPEKTNEISDSIGSNERPTEGVLPESKPD